MNQRAVDLLDKEITALSDAQLKELLIDLDYYLELTKEELERRGI